MPKRTKDGLQEIDSVWVTDKEKTFKVHPPPTSGPVDEETAKSLLSRANLKVEYLGHLNKRHQLLFNTKLFEFDGSSGQLYEALIVRAKEIKKERTETRNKKGPITIIMFGLPRDQ